MKEDNWVFWGVIAFVGYLLISQQGSLSVFQFLNPPQNQTATPPSNVTVVVNPPAAPPHVNLAELGMPYLAATDAIAACNAMGGVFIQTADRIGCQGAGPAACGDAIYLAAAGQCAAVGATWTCNIGNIYCSYY